LELPTRIEIEHQNDVCILCIKGRLASGMDLEYLRSKAEEIKRQSCTKILVDLRDLDSIGSMGIGFIMGIYASVIKNPAGRFVLVSPNARVREVFELTRLDTILPVAANIASGLIALGGDLTHSRSGSG
jgi:anti-anti-sigma factor